MRISVIMPTYCQAAFIEESVRSVLGQSDVELELIVYDAMSTDGTSEILDRFHSEARLKVVCEPDDGQVDALNKGLGRASGDILAWLNSDDLYLPDAILKVVSAFQSDAELDFVYGDALEIDGEGRLLGPNPFTESPTADRYLSSHNFICQPTCFFHRRLWERVGPIKEEMKWVFDYELFRRFFLAGAKCLRLETFLAANRSYAETKTNQGSIARYMEILRTVTTRCGIPFWRLKALVVYAFELVIKEVEPWKEFRHGIRSIIASRYLVPMHLLFHKLVAPRERESIHERYRSQILTKDWQYSRDWLREMDRMVVES